MTDFFISYTGKDTNWAEWIGYALEAKGFNVILQAWDFRPGSNFALEMHKAANTADRTILVLSPDYLKSDFAAPEWAAAFVNDPRGADQRLVPIMVRECKPPGLLTAIVYIRLTGLTEDAARDELLRGVDRKRAKPSSPPIYPGNPPPFPGVTPIDPPENSPPNAAGSGPGTSKNPLRSGADNATAATMSGIPEWKPPKKKLYVFVAVVAAAIAGAAAVASLESRLGTLIPFSCLISGSCKSSSLDPPVLAGYDSPRMGGGHSQSEQCDPLKANYAAQHPNFNIILQSWEDHDKDMFGHVTYTYHCRYAAVPK